MDAIVKVFLDLLKNDAFAGGDPARFNKLLVFLTTQNDAKKWQQEHRARLARDVVSKVQKRLVVIAGPAKASTWDSTDRN